MNIQEAKQIKIADYLQSLGHRPVKQQGGELNVEKKLYVERISAGGSKSLQPVTAVSYTHLDVYKRQVLLSRTLLTVDEVPEDIREWSISQFVDKIDRCNRAS